MNGNFRWGAPVSSKDRTVKNGSGPISPVRVLSLADADQAQNWLGRQASAPQLAQTGKVAAATVAKKITGHIPYNRRVAGPDGDAIMFGARCFSAALAAGDIRALFNGSIDRILGRQSSGNLRLVEDGGGVSWECDMPDTSYAADILTLMRRGDISESSAGFYATVTHLEQGRDGQRTLVVDRGVLVTVGPHTFGSIGALGSVASGAVKSSYEAGYQAGLDERASSRRQTAPPAQNKTQNKINGGSRRVQKFR
jgi:HK97 family phage prohead protease